MTLPMIHALNVMDRSNKKWLINTVKNHNKDKKRVREAIQRIKEAGGLEFAEEKMEYFRVPRHRDTQNLSQKYLPRFFGVDGQLCD